MEVGVVTGAIAIWRLVKLIIRRGYKARAYKRIVSARDALSKRYRTASRRLAVAWRVSVALLPHLSANAAREHLAELTAPVREMLLKTSGGRARAFGPEALLSLPPLGRHPGCLGRQVPPQISGRARLVQIRAATATMEHIEGVRCSP